LATGRELSRETIDLLEDKTEGWVVGLRLAALSVRNLPDAKTFVQRFEGTSSSVIVDYLVSEVLSQQSPVHQDFLLLTSILDRFNAELCDAILWPEEDSLPTTANSSNIPSRTILAELRAANLFLIPLDQEEWWFRYHHLFRDLLQYRLKNKHSSKHIAALHSRASRWFERHGLIDEALTHAFLARQMDRATRIVAQQRYKLMNQARWQRLERYLRRFPPQFANEQPDLLMLKAWLLYHHSHYDQLPTTLGQLEEALGQTTLGQNSLPSESIRYLKGEISALKSLLYYYQTDVERTIAESEFSIRNTPPELWIVRILARLFLGVAFLMRGDLRRAYATIYQGVDEEDVQSHAFRATTLITVCNIHWIVANLQGLIDTANQCLELYDYPRSAEIKGYAHYHLGCGYYHQNDLAAAEEHFATVVQQPYLNYGDGFAHSAFGLSLTYQAQNRPDKAREVAALASAHLLETSNTTLLPVAKAFQAELALRQGQLALADQWAVQFDTIPPLSPMVHFYRPLLTPVKIWIAHDTPASRKQAAESLEQIKNYTEFTHNTAVLIEVLALLAILHAMEDDEPAALNQLGKAIELAQPGGYVRLFLDLGPAMARLLRLLHGKGVYSNYISKILAAFEDAGRLETVDDRRWLSAVVGQPEPLTPREMEVLELLARRLTNKEISTRLVISPGTVKTHTLNIYAKLDVHGRRQAVNKARELGLLPLY
jgi:LuxR family maltose regulon positive regulatory protein